jgi:hypothetical protein
MMAMVMIMASLCMFRDMELCISCGGMLYMRIDTKWRIKRQIENNWAILRKYN